MKTRVGFVSNSSSSSYIIAFDTSRVLDKCPHCGRGDVSVLELIERASSSNRDDNQVEATGMANILAHIKGSYFDDFKLPEQVIVDMRNYEDKKWKLAYISVSYHDDTIKDALENMLAAGTAKKIYYFGD